MNEAQVERGRYYARILLKRHSPTVSGWDSLSCISFLGGTYRPGSQPSAKVLARFIETYKRYFDFKGNAQVLE